MNNKSYNLVLFGEPSLRKPGGWSFWGHHAACCTLVLGTQMVVSPVFRGCEPNVLDAGEDAGTEMFVEEMMLATRMMRTLTEKERASVIVTPNKPSHPNDGYMMAGAYCDNKHMPYVGGRVSQLSRESQQAILKLTEKFLDYLQEGPFQAKMTEVRSYLEESWVMWIGGYGDEDVFYFRIHSPVLLIEFDHVAGMWLANQKPGRFHVHTVVRTPNGNEYGKQLIQKWKASSR